MRKSFKDRLLNLNKENGFSLLELVVAVGILLVLTIGGLLAYNGITKNARVAAVQSAADEVLTGVVAADVQGKSQGEIEAVGESWNNTGKGVITTSVNAYDRTCIVVKAVHTEHADIETIRGTGNGCEYDENGNLIIPPGSDTDGSGNENGDDTGNNSGGNGDETGDETTPPVGENDDNENVEQTTVPVPYGWITGVEEGDSLGNMEGRLMFELFKTTHDNSYPVGTTVSVPSFQRNYLNQFDDITCDNEWINMNGNCPWAVEVVSDNGTEVVYEFTEEKNMPMPMGWFGTETSRTTDADRALFNEGYFYVEITLPDGYVFEDGEKTQRYEANINFDGGYTDFNI